MAQASTCGPARRKRCARFVRAMTYFAPAGARSTPGWFDSGRSMSIGPLIAGPRRHHADAGHGHQPPCRFFRPRQLPDLTIQPLKLAADMIMHREQWLKDRPEGVFIAAQFNDAATELTGNRPRKDQPVFLQAWTGPGFPSPCGSHQPRPRDEQGADLLTGFALDCHFPIPTDPHKLGQTPGVVLVALVHPDGQNRVRVPRIDADHRQTDPLQFMPEPARHGAGLEAHPFRQRCLLCQNCSQSADLARPSKITRPFSSTTQTAVSFCETSKPTYCVIVMSSHDQQDECATIDGSGRYGQQ